MNILRFLLPLMLLTVACSLTSSSNSDNPQPAGNVTTLSPNQSAATMTIRARTPVSAGNPTATGGALQSTPTGCPAPTNWINYTIQSGDTLSGIAAKVQTTVSELTRINCNLNPDQIDVGQVIYVPRLPSPNTPAPQTTCATTWFFRFDPEDQINSCPNAVISVSAVGQNFEGGRVLWYNSSALGSMPDKLFVIYNDRSWQLYDATWVQGEAENNPSLTPPADRYQPVRSIGKLWRENQAVRDKLGWAYNNEVSFNGRIQEVQGTSWTVQPGNPFYIDHGRDGIVLQLNTRSAANGGNTWKVAGRY